MRTFAELLREYTARTGVSDAELARAVGVQRQTVFRWKEGLVARPRSAEDVLRLAAKLRLSEGERDELLLAAGFPPVGPPERSAAESKDALDAPAPTQDAAGAPPPAHDAADAPPSAQDAAGAPALASDTLRLPLSHKNASDAPPSAMDASGAYERMEHPERRPEGPESKDALFRPGHPSRPGYSSRRGHPSQLGLPSRARRLAIVAIALLSIAAGLVLIRQSGRYPLASAGETLIVVAPFANYTGGEQGYNVAGRLVEALERELAAAGLAGVRAAAWPDAVTDAGAAAGVLQRSGAGLLIWGEYDSGRVVTRFLPRGTAGGQERMFLAATPADLPAVINSALPSDIRYVALASLARIYLDRGDAARALAALGQAGLSLPGGASTEAAHHFLVGYANQVSAPPDVDAAIRAYTDALALDPGLDAAHHNRAVAYLHRRGPGDLAAAVDDLTRYLAGHSDDATAFSNRGSAYLSLGGEENARRALVDLDRALALDENSVAARYNRGLAYVRLNQTEKWRADFERVLELEFAHLGAVEGMCWGYALSEDPQEGIDWCGEAVEGRGATAWENYAIACARSGEFEYARTLLTEHRSEIAGTNDGASPSKSARIDAWLAELAAGKNPFDEATLEALRQE